MTQERTKESSLEARKGDNSKMVTKWAPKHSRERSNYTEEKFAGSQHIEMVF